MGAYGGPDIITDGLVFAVDAGSERSYPGSGTTATSLISSNTGTLTNGVGFGSGNGGHWEFDGVDDYVNIGNGVSFEYTDSFSFSTWINPSAKSGVKYLYSKYQTSKESMSSVQIQ